MPDGRVLRIDDEQQCVYIVRRGRTYRAPLSEVETAARVPSARVHFGLRRSHGTETAESVKLRKGSRTNHRHRRFGDLTGATRPGSKIRTTAHDEFGIDVTTQPFRVVEAWLESMDEQNYDLATSLYLPEAVVHTASGSDTGRRHIRALLEDSGWRADLSDVILHGEDRNVLVELPEDSDVPPTAFSIRRGAIVEHWLGIEPDWEPVPEAPTVEIEVVNRTGVPDGAVTYAEERLHNLVDHISDPVHAARIKLSMSANPTVVVPAVAESTIDLGGEFLRVAASARTLNEAVDQVLGKLRSKVESRRDRHRHDPTGLPSAEGSWRHGNRPSPVLPYFDRPADEREIVRHKTFAPTDMTIEEAAWDADLMDFDFFLFVELTTGNDCVLERTENSYAVHGLDQPPPDIGPNGSNFEFINDIAPVQSLSVAIEVLDQAGAPFHFFKNEKSGRGNVLYRRFDGHYGLITPTVDNA
ncbi:MAG: sigma 54 modulation/S30EA ribosomal C-terminal domain-containing protein [Acidimicrobiales bacterium]